MQAMNEQNNSTSDFLKKALELNRHDRRAIFAQERKEAKKQGNAEKVEKIIRDSKLLTIGE